tara:strand:- start:264 stop:1718 length:1455 start_codon:yes stop_codon:yes gene_type:complete
MQAVARYLDYNSMVSLKPLLKKYFFENPDDFIESIRVISEGNTENLSEFTINIETRIFQSRIISAFRKLGLPPLDERVAFRDYYLIYNAENEFRQTEFLTKFLEQLHARLKPYRIRTKDILVNEKFLSVKAGMQARLNLLKSNHDEQTDKKSFPLLELKSSKIADGNDPQQHNLKTEIIFWSPENKLTDSPIIIASATALMPYSSEQIDSIIPQLLDRLMLNWTPVIKKVLIFNEGRGIKVKIKFIGLYGPVEEQLLVKTLFHNNPRWKNLRLDTISSNFVSYRSLYLGNKDKMLKEFFLPPDSQFQISELKWEDNYLVVNVTWHELIASLEPYFTLDEGNDIDEETEENNFPIPEFQVPLSPFKQTYRLPLTSTVYDNIRHRGDSTLFKIKADKDNESYEEKNLIKITWNRLGLTHLQPKLTIYDHNRKRVKGYLLKRKKHFSFQYILPEGKDAFYLRISDEIGFLEGVAGSYQSFRYILTVN